MDMVSILKVADGSSAVSACTVALTPIFASAPLTMPHGNHRNCPRTSAM